jgi:hypothetical protein
MQDFGAPPSLRIQAERTVEQEEKIIHVRQLERQARAIVKQLEADPHVERQSLITARLHLKVGCMLLVNAITREDLL